jgi:hypothetical protein
MSFVEEDVMIYLKIINTDRANEIMGKQEGEASDAR